MKNETNHSVEGIVIHDIVVLTKHQKTGENGEKKGYSWYEKDQIGVVTQIGEDKLVMTLADGSEETYAVDKTDDEYYFTIGRGSEVQYENEIKKNIDKLKEESLKKFQEVRDLEVWLSDFKNSISFLGRVARFIKAFK